MCRTRKKRLGEALIVPLVTPGFETRLRILPQQGHYTSRQALLSRDLQGAD